MSPRKIPANFTALQANFDEPGCHINRGEEFAFIPDHSNWTVDDLLYINDVGLTMPNPQYHVVREEGHLDWRHQYVFEYVLSGYGHIESNRQKYDVGPGDLYFLNRLHSHAYYADAEEPFCKLWVNASGKLLNSLVELYGISESVVIRHYEAEPIFREIHAITATLTADNRTSVCNAISLQLHALLQILSAVERHEADGVDNITRAMQIKHYIDTRSSFDLSLDEIAEHFFLNKAYLSRIFRQAYQMTPKQYMQIRRIEAAQNMLSNSSVSIQQIAQILHFSSPQHFSTTFHHVIGVTPGEYRRQFS